MMRSYAGAGGLASVVAAVQQLLKKRWPETGLICNESGKGR
jgi:hypothetical protein